MSHDDIHLVIPNENLVDVALEYTKIVPTTIPVDPTVYTFTNLDASVQVMVDVDNMDYVDGIVRTYYGLVGRLMHFSRSVIGRKKTFGQTSFVITNSRITSGIRGLAGSSGIINRPITFIKSVAGRKTTFGATSFNIVDTITTRAASFLGNVSFYGTDDYSDRAYSYDNLPSASLLMNFGSTVSGNTSAPTPKQTPVAEISLASHGTPSARTDHTIKIRARTLTGSTGVLKAALFEGGINRSGNLTTIPLTNSLADYSLSISEASADGISSYANLSLKIWGYDSVGNSLVFEVARAYLELPTSSGTTKTTPVAEISLGSHGIPSARTNHAIRIRARTQNGSTGVIRAALYEGATNRSGDLSSIILDNTLTDYTLPIPSASAANITDYSNLSLKIWGYDSAGNALVFEVASVYLELPTATNKYGAISSVTTFNRTTAGNEVFKTTPVASISLASHGVPSVRTNHSIKIRARTTTNADGKIMVALYEGGVNRSGDIASGILTTALTDHTIVIPDAAAASITDYSNLTLKIWGFNSGGTGLVFEVAKAYLELPVPAGATTHYGVVNRVTTFSSTTAGNEVFKTTPVAEISLASHGTPSVRTNHSIKVRARTTASGDGKIMAALYEGSTNRSGDIVSGTITNALADYTLVIPDAAAAAITSYSNLSIKVWGFNSGGTGLVYEVARLYLELPIP